MHIQAEIHGYLFSAVCQRGACHADAVKIEGLQFIHIPTALANKADHALQKKSQCLRPIRFRTGNGGMHLAVLPIEIGGEIAATTVFPFSSPNFKSSFMV